MDSNSTHGHSSGPRDTSADTPKIELEGVRKAFGDNVVLDGLDLSIGAGESVVVIGGSGSGKSVMLKCILGLIAPDSGTIRIDGEDATHMNGRQREALMHRFGMLFQGGALFDSLPVSENIAFGALQRRMIKRSEALDLAVDKLTSVGLDASVAHLYPAELSGGMQKRVALARAIATNPEIIFFDEPTTGLDPIMGDTINRLIRDLVGKMGATALTITHDMASAKHIADRVAMIYRGRIVWSGPASDIDHSGNDHVDQFVHGRAEGPITVPGANRTTG